MKPLKEQTLSPRQKYLLALDIMKMSVSLTASQTNPSSGMKTIEINMKRNHQIICEIFKKSLGGKS
jgi:hypothetical protein